MPKHLFILKKMLNTFFSINYFLSFNSCPVNYNPKFEIIFLANNADYRMEMEMYKNRKEKL